MNGTGCDVAILAGGQGTRLRERAGPLPKPMVPLLGRPILDHQLDLCRLHGFRRVLLLVHYNPEAIRAHVGDGSRYGLSVEYAVESTPRGTAGALADALPRLADTFLVLYGDTYLDVDLRRLREAHEERRADATLFVHPNDHPQDSDLVEVDDHGFVAALHPYPHAEGTEYDNLVNAALYVMRRDRLEHVIPPEAKADLAKDLFPQMLRAGRRLFAYISPEYIKDVGTPERLDRVAADIQAGLPDRLSARALRSAVFLDRDGTGERGGQLPPHAGATGTAAGRPRGAAASQPIRPPRCYRHKPGGRRPRRRDVRRFEAHSYASDPSPRHRPCLRRSDLRLSPSSRWRISRRGRRVEIRLHVPEARDRHGGRRLPRFGDRPARVVDGGRHDRRHGNGPAGGTSNRARSNRPPRTGRAIPLSGPITWCPTCRRRCRGFWTDTQRWSDAWRR